MLRKRLLAVAAVPPLALLLDGLLGWWFYNEYHFPTITPHPCKDSETTRRIVYFPGMQNSGDLTIKQCLDDLTELGTVLVVNYPENAFKIDQVVTMVLIYLEKLGPIDQIDIIGQSFGAAVAMDFMRYAESQPELAGSIGRFISICGPTGAGDIKNPLVHLAPMIRLGPVQRWLYETLQGPFIRLLGVQKPEAGVDPKLVKDHCDYIWGHNARGGIAQLQYLNRFVAPRRGEFAGIPALLIKTLGQDVFVRDSAIETLAEAFPIHSMRELPGIHANLVEFPREYGPAILRGLEA